MRFIVNSGDIGAIQEFLTEVGEEGFPYISNVDFAKTVTISFLNDVHLRLPLGYFLYEYPRGVSVASPEYFLDVLYKSKGKRRGISQRVFEVIAQDPFEAVQWTGGNEEEVTYFLEIRGYEPERSMDDIIFQEFSEDSSYTHMLPFDTAVDFFGHIAVFSEDEFSLYFSLDH